jgi:hypothetical protein
MLALIGMVAGAARHFGEEAHRFGGLLGHMDHLLIAAASMAAAFVAFTVVCGILVWRFLRPKHGRGAGTPRRRTYL